MARAELPIQTTSSSGLAAAYTAATLDGHAFDNTKENVLLHVKNAGGVDTTITIDVVKTVDGLVVPDKVVVVPAGADRFIGPFRKSVYNQDIAVPDIAEAVLVNASPQASVTYSAIKMGALS